MTGGATAVTSTFAAPAPAGAATTPAFPGHIPGKIRLGWAPGGDLGTTEGKTGKVTVRRSYHEWANATYEAKLISEDHAAKRVPWVSFKPPYETAGGWAAVASGKYDADIRARARRYAALTTGPVIATFHHEPHRYRDKTGTPAEFAAAWVRIHDIMKNETGLKNVASAPIIGEWVYSRYNKRDEPEEFITPAVLDRCHFLGVDLYQNKHGDGYAERLGYILSWLDGKGHSTKMVGLGETGCSNGFGTPNGAAWWKKCWDWAALNTKRVGVIAYWNSVGSDASTQNWVLWESSDKLSAFKSSLTSTAAVSAGAALL